MIGVSGGSIASVEIMGVRGEKGLKKGPKAEMGRKW
jgi:hypothetical protein